MIFGSRFSGWRSVAERWRWVRGHVGYEVSDQGRMRSYRSPGKAPGLLKTPRLLTLSQAKNGYIQVTLAEPRRKRYVHDLVAEAFVGQRPAGAHIAHGNGVPTDNRAVNLRYDTPAGNAADRVAHGTDCRGERCGTHKLTEAEVTQIRTLYDAGVKQSELAQKFGVVQQTISKITRGDHWVATAGPTHRRAR